MASRRDQLQSYQFLIQRVISAFVMRETDPAQSPLRRGIGAVFAGIMATVLVAAGFGVYGLLTKVGGTDWKSDGAVVVERETGATFVYLGGKLNPTINYASAVLVSGKGVASVYRVAHKSLADVPRGPTVGIVGAPNSLPAADQAVGLPWTVCSTAGTDSAGGAIATVTLVAGAQPAGARGAGAGQGLLVQDSRTNGIYLVANVYKHQIRNDPGVVIRALFGEGAHGAIVGTSWINALPGGPDIGPIQVDGRNTASKNVPGRKVGDVLKAQTGSGPQYYLVLDDGLAPITELQRLILDAQNPQEPATVSVADASAAKRSLKIVEATGDSAPPAAPPKLDVQPTAAADPVCATTTDATSAPRISVGGTVNGLADGVQTIGRTGDGTSLADKVTVPAGHVAVIRIMASAGAKTGAYAIVTDSGIRYSVPSITVLATLGYPAQKAVDVPGALVNRIPAGPVLDPDAARQPAVPAVGGSTTRPPAPTSGPSGN
jgi:type VII secretion protein EccB